jgi:hypothetical protein
VTSCDAKHEENAMKKDITIVDVRESRIRGKAECQTVKPQNESFKT